MLLFRKLVDETQMPTTHETTWHHSFFFKKSDDPSNPQSSTTSEPFRIIRFNMRHPVCSQKLPECDVNV